MVTRSPTPRRDWRTEARDRKDDPDRRFLMSREWRERIRPTQLSREPFCAWCRLLGRTELANSVDHIVRPKGDRDLQRDFANFRSLCGWHHQQKSLWERRGDGRPLRIGCGSDGWPVEVDPLTPAAPFDPVLV